VYLSYLQATIFDSDYLVYDPLKISPYVFCFPAHSLFMSHVVTVGCVYWKRQPINREFFSDGNFNAHPNLSYIVPNTAAWLRRVKVQSFLATYNHRAVMISI